MIESGSDTRYGGVVTRDGPGFLNVWGDARTSPAGIRARRNFADGGTGSDAGTVIPDAGVAVDAGTLQPRALTVGCGCSSGPGPLFLLLSAAWVLRRTGARPSSASVEVGRVGRCHGWASSARAAAPPASVICVKHWPR